MNFTEWQWQKNRTSAGIMRFAGMLAGQPVPIYRDAASAAIL